MSANRLYDTWFHLIRELRPTGRITQVRNLAWLIVGMLLSRSVHLSAVAAKLPFRVTLLATLKRTRIALQADVGSGDAVVPPAEEIDYPTLLDMPAPRFRAYSLYTVVAEKFSAMVELGMANSRVRDYYDIWALAQDFEFDSDILRSAIDATFGRRNAKTPTGSPGGLSDAYASAAQSYWSPFLRRSVPTERALTLGEVVAGIRAFLDPVLSGQSGGQAWRPGKGWQKKAKGKRSG